MIQFLYHSFKLLPVAKRVGDGQEETGTNFFSMNYEVKTGVHEKEERWASCRTLLGRRMNSYVKWPECKFRPNYKEALISVTNASGLYMMNHGDYPLLQAHRLFRERDFHNAAILPQRVLNNLHIFLQAHHGKLLIQFPARCLYQVILAHTRNLEKTKGDQSEGLEFLTVLAAIISCAVSPTFLAVDLYWKDQTLKRMCDKHVEDLVGRGRAFDMPAYKDKSSRVGRIWWVIFVVLFLQWVAAIYCGATLAFECKSEISRLFAGTSNITKVMVGVEDGCNEFYNNTLPS